MERPGPATPQKPNLSDALIKFVKTDGEVTGGLQELAEALRDAPAYYKAVKGQFLNWLDTEEARGEENIYVTEDFIKTIRGRHNADSHLGRERAGLCGGGPVSDQCQTTVS